jgi:hypothetical protein
MKNIILYAYYKGDNDGEVALDFFLKYGVKEHPDYDYYFINSGEPTTQKIPSFFTIINRPNIAYDFGAWSDAILSIDTSKYDYFIFLNNSSIGPCMPRYLKNVFWPELFYKHIDAKTKLVGCTTNFDGMEHIQSYVFCVDIIGLNILINNKIFTKNMIKNKKQVIEDCEMKMLYYIKNDRYNGYTFETVRNYDNKQKIINGNLSDGTYFKDNYYHDISPFEVIFVKQRLNHTNNSLLFYLKSMNIELIKTEINNTENNKLELNKNNNIKFLQINIDNTSKETLKIIAPKNKIENNIIKKYLIR